MYTTGVSLSESAELVFLGLLGYCGILCSGDSLTQAKGNVDLAVLVKDATL